MFDKEAIEALQKASGIEEANAPIGVNIENGVPLALPETFKLHDLESYSNLRTRPRGKMTTPSLASFAAYTKAHALAGTTVFIDRDDLQARAVLNLGNTVYPGHADNVADFIPKKTAAYHDLGRMLATGSHSQKAVAEFLEDWAGQVTCFNTGDSVDDEPSAAIPPKHAIAAIRKITIEAMHKLEASEQSLSASRSAFESVSARADYQIPTLIYFRCQPFADLSERDFLLRLGILTGGDKPMITLRVIKPEEHAEEMAQELSDKIEAAISGAGASDNDKGISVVIGTYAKGA